MNFLKRIIFISIVLALVTQIADARPNEKYIKKKESTVQRDPLGFFDFQENTVSNIQTVISNYGMIGYDRPKGRGSGYFPRGSRNQYIFGGGLWYGGQKKVPFTDEDGVEGFKLNKLVSISYNPSQADSWLTPGRVEDGDISIQDNEKYKVFLSTDYSRNDGVALDPTDVNTPNWPVWDTSEEDTLGYSRYFGYYLYDDTERNIDKYPKGPAMISGEDIFTTFHDLDLSQYEGALSTNRALGYPLGLQYEFTIYSWGFGQYQNFFFCLYDVINMSEDTLYDCWLAPIMDVDLARNPFLFAGAANDRVSYWYEDPELNMAYQFTNPEFGEQGQGFGYLGFDFLESPTIIRPPLLDDEGNEIIEIIEKDLGGGVTIFDTVIVADESHPDYKFLRKDSAYYDNSNQLGLVTFKNWNLQEDVSGIERMYNFISDGVTDVDFGPGDKRYMMATGAFHMRPGDTSRTVVCIMIATPSKTGDADGTREDREGLYTLDLFAQAVYDNNFRAPRPPDQARIKYYRALNNGITIAWDSTSELSSDREEAGLDFLGYRIDRARRPDLDTFSISQIAPGTEFQRGAGPYGWKEVARYQLPLPFLESERLVSNPNTGTVSIDSMMIVGPVYDENGDIRDTSAIRVMRAGNGIVFHPLDLSFRNTGEYIPTIAGINPTQPWGEYYIDLAEEDGFSQNQYNNYGVRHRFDRNDVLFDSALVGLIELDPARVPYNPLYVDHYTFEVSRNYIENVLDTLDIDGIAVRYKMKEVQLEDTTVFVESSIVDSVYFVKTGRTLQQDGSETYIVDGALPISNFKDAMKDSVRVKRALDSIYSYIRQGKVIFNFNDFQSSMSVKNNYILPYMNRITNGRTFTDIGDDNRDGIFSSDDDFDNSEKLINNTPYYYRVLAYDRGDASQPTPSKINSSIDGVNQVETFPEAIEVGKKLKFEIIDMDSNKLNGLYDFDFYAINEDRTKQLFLGDTLQLDFNVEWNYNTFRFQNRDETDPDPINTSAYIRRATITNLSQDSSVIFEQFMTFNPNGCYSTNDLATAMYENASAIVQSTDPIINEFGDTVNTFGVWNNDEYIDFSGRYTTGDFTEQNQCNNQFFRAPAYGTIGFDFKFGLAQQGGRYRSGTIEIIEGDAETSVYSLDKPLKSEDSDYGTRTIQAIDTIRGAKRLVRNANQSEARDFIIPVYASFNNGPIDAVLEFTGTGTETIELEWGRSLDLTKSPDYQTSTFTVEYLDVKLTNNYELVPSSENNFVISNKDEFEHISIDPIVDGDIETDQPITENVNVVVERFPYPDPRNLPAQGIEPEEYIGKFNLHSYAHVNIDEFNQTIKTFYYKTVGRPVNKPELTTVDGSYSGLPQGRYYLRGTDDEGNTVDFVNVLNVAGAQFVLDNRTLKRTSKEKYNLEIKTPGISQKDFTDPVEDFEVGDKVRLTTEGGASGLPFPGASLKVVIRDEQETAGITDNDMEGIKVVPNPYYISHANEKTPYNSKLYFTKVPPGSTINIYTVGGNLIETIEHDPFGAELDRGRVAVNVWDLIMKNGLRVQSQTLVAHIVSPDGAETMEKFSIVVGTFNTFD